MKKYLFLLFGTALVATACNNSSTGTASDSKMSDSTGNNSAQDNLAKNRSVYTAIENGDSATISGLIASDAVDHEGPNGTEVKGGPNIVHMLSDMHNHIKDLKFDVLSDAAKGDYVFSMVQIKGTTNDNSWGTPAGTKMDSKGVDVVKIRDGKMVEHWGFMDPNDMMKMMGNHPPMGDSAHKK
jgi:predicted ester cyclase